MKTAAGKIGRSAGDVFFPRVCVGCAGLPEEGGYRHVCAACAAQIEFAEDPACTTCGHPYYGVVEGERACPHCEGLAPAYREGRTCVLMKGAARALVHELKYHHGFHVLEDIAALAGRSARVMEFVRGAVLVPVPLHARKQRERGYNQALLLAECLARTAGGGTRVEELLERTVDTVSQTAFDRRTRRENLKNAFALRRGATINAAQHHLLIDDVFTTGSTLNSCAGVLRRAGCLNLGVVTFGHG